MIVVLDAECNTVPDTVRMIPTQGDALSNVLVAMGYDPSHSPVAYLLKHYHNLAGDWAVVSPIHWEASHNDAMVSAYGAQLGLSEADSKLWYQSYADYLAEEGMSLHYHRADMWLLRIDGKPYLNAKPVHQLLNHSLMPELSALDITMYWQKFITESQMFFASMPNTTLINGVWLWGNSPVQTHRLVIGCSPHYYPLMNAINSDTRLYHPSCNLKEFDLLILDDMDALSIAHQQLLKYQSTSWYWNNTAYIKTNSNWLTRLWRHLIHAH